ncbi:hypothetical protein MTR67_034376 [Solanum verrucosum]|uniref:Integrase zinc-binding domain-containing protein n=1 Tax=Solanum verrucosum TaxID=315347 RepID=A0AAF0U8A2_SOLVR|nr:hypothetical protein MTR67_034376 [Solanum verrucosum]
MSISDSCITVQNGSESSLVAEVKEKHNSDPIFLQLKGAVHHQRVDVFSQGEDRVLRYQRRLGVPKVGELRQQILAETHNSRYYIHPGTTKMYSDLREDFRWNGRKRDIADFMAKCPNCQQVKVEHQKLGAMTQEINIPTWKWEVINIDFIIGLPRTHRQHDSIWVIVDRVTKSARFLVVKTTDSAKDYAKLYINEIVRFHGVPLSIISDRGETALIGAYSVHDVMEKVQLIRDRLRTAQSHQKSYANVRRRALEFQVNDWVFLKVSPMKWGDEKCVGDPTSIVPLESVAVKDGLTYEDVPVEFLDRQVTRLRNKEVASVKVLWRSRSVEGDTWEAKQP